MIAKLFAVLLAAACTEASPLRTLKRGGGWKGKGKGGRRRRGGKLLYAVCNEGTTKTVRGMDFAFPPLPASLSAIKPSAEECGKLETCVAAKMEIIMGGEGDAAEPSERRLRRGKMNLSDSQKENLAALKEEGGACFGLQDIAKQLRGGLKDSNGNADYQEDLQKFRADLREQKQKLRAARREQKQQAMGDN